MLEPLPHLRLLQSCLLEKAPLFKKTFQEVRAAFGPASELDFDQHLGRLFGTDETSYRDGVLGYASFSLDAMRLQVLFNQRKRYEPVTYDEAAQRVYLNDEYMRQVYLPGIFLSQFLWRHHYRELQFYRTCFLPLLDALADKRFYEVGPGTAFFTVQLLRHDRAVHGYGIDLSPHSLRFTLDHVNAWQCGDRFDAVNADILDTDLEQLPFLQTIEVLEHLPDPPVFLARLRAMLQPGGYGFIAAALTAPQADHIYLYWNPDDVIAQLLAAGFRVEDYREEPAYAGLPGELVPRVAAFIVS